jgi:transposase
MTYKAISCPIVSLVLSPMAQNTLLVFVSSSHASSNTKIHLLYGYYHLGLSRKALSIIYCKSRRCVDNWISRWEEFKSVARLSGGVNPRKFNQDKKDFVISCFDSHPCSFLDEVRLQFIKEYGSNISISSVWRIINEAGYTRKVIERRALEISYKDIIRFYEDLQSLPFKWKYENLIFLDEVGFDNRDMLRKRGYALKGNRIIYRGEFTRKKRISLLCFLGINGIQEVFSTEGTFDRFKFLACCKQFATGGKTLPYPGKHSVWILDGASIHCDKNITYYLRSIGIFLVFLPAYCPFFNPIEIVFGNIKMHLTRYYKENSSLSDISVFIAGTMKQFMNRSMRQIFLKCGYGNCGQFDPGVAFKQNIQNFGY